MVEKGFRVVVVLVVGVYVARYLGPEQFGLLNYAMSFAALLMPIAALGLDGIVVRELIKDETKRSELLVTAFLLKLIGASLALLSLYIVLNFVSNDGLANLLIFIIASSAVFQSFNVIDFYFQAKVLSKYAVYVRVMSLTISSLIKVLLVLSKAPLLYFAFVFLIESIVLSGGLLIVYFRLKLNGFSWKPRLKLALELLKDSWPLILSGLAIMVYMRIDQIMIKKMLGSEAVGQYAAAVRLSEASYFIPVLVCNSLFPAIVNAKKQSKERYYARLQRLYDLMAWTAIPVVLVMTLFANSIIQLLYGLEFSEAGSVLAIYVWAGVFVFLGVASSKYLIAENYTKISLIRTSVGMVLNVLLNVLLIPSYQIVGAAFATLISYAAATFSVALFDSTQPIAFMMLKSLLFPCRKLLCLGKNHEKYQNVHLESGKDFPRYSHECEDTVL